MLQIPPHFKVMGMIDSIIHNMFQENTSILQRWRSIQDSWRFERFRGNAWRNKQTLFGVVNPTIWTEALQSCQNVFLVFFDEENDESELGNY